MSKDNLLYELMELFRTYGYDGVSISQISHATGLGKSSLYHHFPGGKEQMANEVIAQVRTDIRTAFIAPLISPGFPLKRLDGMLAAVRSFYADGQKNCLVDGLTLGAANSLFQKSIAASVSEWQEALSTLFQDAGFPKREARNQAEEILIEIEGALIISRALGENGAFIRTLRKIRSRLENAKPSP